MAGSGEWADATVGSVLSLEYGKGLPAESRTGSGHPVFGSSGEVGRHAEVLVEGPGIVVGRKGTVGSVIWSDEPFWPIDTTYFVQRRCNVDFRWLFWRLSTLDLGALDSSTGVPGLHRNDAYERPLRLPPVLEQRGIAAILDTVDEAIRRTEQVIAKLKQMKEGLLHDLLTRGVDENGDLRPPPSEAPHLYKDSPMGRVPKGWEVPLIENLVVHVGSGVTPRGGSETYLSSGVLFIRSQNVHFDGLHLDDAAFISETTHRAMARSEVFPNDVLLNITGASIGRCCTVPEALGMANVNQHVCAIRMPEPTITDALYLSAFLGSPFGQHQVDVLNAGSNRQGLNYKQVRAFRVLWPDKSERERATEIIRAHDDRDWRERCGLEKLRTLKEGLLHDLLTGRVRVPLEGDVPP